MRLLLTAPLLLLTVACGGGGDSDVAVPAPSEPPATDGDLAAGGGGTELADRNLLVHYDAGDGSAVQEWTLDCLREPQGTHPDPAAACAHLASVEDPFAPVPDDAVCTEQYGGPQTATVLGKWGDPVDLRMSRTNGCYIWQWERVGPLLPQDVGVEPPADAPQ